MTRPMSELQNHTPPHTAAALLKRWGPVAALLAALTAFFATGLHQRLTLDELALQYAGLSAFVADNWLQSVLVTIIVYLTAVAASFPAAWLLTVAIGLVFGWALGAFIVVIGATLGASVLFFAARSLLADFFRARAGARLNTMADGFRNNAASYMLFLRLAPVFPFLLVNVVPAILGVRFRTYFWTTALGIIPGTIAYAFAGEGLRSIVGERARACAAGIDPCGQPFSARDIITWEMLIAFTLLALVSVMPALLKRFRGKRHDTPSPD
ncbi:MAG TPA: TVP38/TMEM64 family protein [Devosia sp.]|nr:TVP38/TMEM64 family protein [Devosia sp.]